MAAAMMSATELDAPSQHGISIPAEPPNPCRHPERSLGRLCEPRRSEGSLTLRGRRRWEMKMTNGECGMTKEARMTNGRACCAFGLRALSFPRHSSSVIRHSAFGVCPAASARVSVSDPSLRAAPPSPARRFVQDDGLFFRWAAASPTPDRTTSSAAQCKRGIFGGSRPRWIGTPGSDEAGEAAKLEDGFAGLTGCGEVDVELGDPVVRFCGIDKHLLDAP